MQRFAAPFEEARTHEPRRDRLAELDAVDDLAAEIAARSGEVEAARRLPADLAHRLAGAGLFRIMVPKDYVGAVGLGIARRAIDELVDLGARKKPTGSQRLLLESSAVQERVGEAEAALRSASAFLFDAIEDAWGFAAAGEPLPLVEHASLRVASANAAWQSAKAVDLMYHAGGGSSVHMTSPLQRCFRDVHVVTQHQRVNASVFSVAGRLYSGLGPVPVGF